MLQFLKLFLIVINNSPANAIETQKFSEFCKYITNAFTNAFTPNTNAF